MKKTKRFLSLIAIFIISILALSCAFLFACGKSDDEGGSDVHVHTYGAAVWSDPVEGSDGKYSVTVTYTCTSCDEGTSGHTLSSTYTYEVGSSSVVPGTTHTHSYGSVVWGNAELNSDGTKYVVTGTMTCEGCEDGTDGHTLEVSYSYDAPESSEGGETPTTHTHTYGDAVWGEASWDETTQKYVVTGTMTCTGCEEGTDGHTLEVSYSYDAPESSEGGETPTTHTHTYGDAVWGEASWDETTQKYIVTGTMTCEGCEEGTDGHTLEVSYSYDAPESSEGGETGSAHTHVYGTPSWSTEKTGNTTYTVTVTWACEDQNCPDYEGSKLTSSFTYTASGEAASEHTHSFGSVTADDVTWNWDELAWDSNGTTGHITVTVKCVGCEEDVTFRATVESAEATAEDGDICQSTSASPVKYTATVTIGGDEYTDVVLISGHSIEKVEYKDATCGEAGTYEYYKCTNDDCNGCFSDAEGTSILTDEQISALDIPATGHTLPTTYTNGNFVWPDEDASGNELAFTVEDTGSSVSVQLICTVCGQTAETVTATITNAYGTNAQDGGLGTFTYVAAATTAAGDEITLTYVVYTAGEHTAPSATETAEKDYIVFDWSDAATTGYVSYTIYCTNTSHVDDVTQLTDILAQGSVAYTSAITTEATCETEGLATYTATVSITIGSTTYTYTDEQTKELEAIGHDLTKVAAVEATCATTGNIEYWVCSTCGEYFVVDEDEDLGYKKVEDKNSVITDKSEVHTIPDLTDNTTGYVVWNWTEANSEVAVVTVDIYCSVCGELITTLENTAVTFVKDDSTSCAGTCGLTGLNVYIGTAVFETTIGGSVIDSITMKNTHSVVVPATGEHTYTAGSHIEWEFEYEYDSTNNYTGRAFVTCDVCGYVHEINASVTVNDADAATCDEAGKTVYTMTASEDTVEYTFTYTVEHEALGHKLTKTEAEAPTCDDEGNIEYYTCERCNKLFADAEGTIEITEADTVIAALGHTYPIDSDDNYADCVIWTWTPIYENEVFTGNYIVTLTIYCSTCGEEVLYSTTEDNESASEDYNVKSGSGYILVSTVTFGEYIYTSEYDTSDDIENEEDRENDYVHSHEWVVVWTWYEDSTAESGYVCYAVISCTGCGVTSGAISATVTITTVEADCQNVSKTTYSAAATWDPLAENNTLTFTTDEENSIIVNGVVYGGHTLQKVEAEEATCKEDGNGEYWYCDVDGCGKVFADETGVIEASVEDFVIPAAHTIPKYSKDTASMFVWVLNGDEVEGGAVTVLVYCAAEGCGEIATTITATITSIDAESNAPTCESEGYITYTATTGTGLEIVTYTWTVTVDALGHTYPTDPDTTVEVGESTKAAVKWSTPEQTNDGYKVSVSVYCTICGKELTTGNTEVEAMLNSDGSYTATLELDGYEYTYTFNTQNPEKDAHVHSFEASWDWVWDEETEQYVVTVTIICTAEGCSEPAEGIVYSSENNDFTVDEDQASKVEASCEETGSVTYIATVDHDGITFTSTKTDVIAATGHTNVTKVDAVDPDCSTQTNGTRGADGHTEMWVCSDCNKYFADEECTIEITANNKDGYIIPWAHTYTEDSRITWVWMEDDTTESGFMVIVGVYCVECDEVGYYVYIDEGIEIIDSEASTCVINGYKTYETSVTIALTDGEGNTYYATYTSTYVKTLPLDDEVHTYTEESDYTFIWVFDTEKGWIAYIEITCDVCDDEAENHVMMYDSVVVTTEGNGTCTATFTTADGIPFTGDFKPVATPDAEADKAGLLLGGKDDDGTAVYAEGFNYTITVEIETDEDGNITYVYTLDGDASAMSEDVANWFGDNVDAGEAYVTLKIYVPEGYTISYISANGAQKTYTNSEDKDAKQFVDGYFFVIVRLTAIDETGDTYVRTSNTYTISGTDEDGNEVSWTIEAKFGNIELPKQYVYNFSDEEFVESIKDAFANTHKKSGDGTEEETEWDARDSEEIALDENGFLTLVDYVTSSGYKTDGTKNNRLSTGGSTTSNSESETGLSNYIVVDLSEVTGNIIISIEFKSSGSGDSASEERCLYVSTALMAGSSAGSDLTGVILGSASSTGNDESNATLVVELDTADYNDLEALYIIYSGSLYIYNITITVVSD